MGSIHILFYFLILKCFAGSIHFPALLLLLVSMRYVCLWGCEIGCYVVRSIGRCTSGQTALATQKGVFFVFVLRNLAFLPRGLNSEAYYLRAPLSLLDKWIFELIYFVHEVSYRTLALLYPGDGHHCTHLDWREQGRALASLLPVGASHSVPSNWGHSPFSRSFYLVLHSPKLCRLFSPSSLAPRGTRSFV